MYFVLIKLNLLGLFQLSLNYLGSYLICRKQTVRVKGSILKNILSFHLEFLKIIILDGHYLLKIHPSYRLYKYINAFAFSLSQPFLMSLHLFVHSNVALTKTNCALIAKHKAITLLYSSSIT